MDISVERKRKKDLDTVMQHVYCSIGTISGYEYTVEEREVVVERLPDVAAVHVELANAYLRAGQLDKATAALTRAEELGFPINNIILNQHACIALARQQTDKALDFLERACRSFPDSTVKGNYDKLAAWIDSRTSGQVKPCLLCDSVRAQDFVFRADETAP
jgi:tetratricopeptide (TPR) repeat protein